MRKKKAAWKHQRNQPLNGHCHSAVDPAIGRCHANGATFAPPLSSLLPSIKEIFINKYIFRIVIYTQKKHIFFLRSWAAGWHRLQLTRCFATWWIDAIDAVSIAALLLFSLSFSLSLFPLGTMQTARVLSLSIQHQLFFFFIYLFIITITIDSTGFF